MDSLHNRPIVNVFGFLGVAAAWGVVVFALRATTVVHAITYYGSGPALDLPRWWRYSWLPWPSSIGIAILYAVVGALFARLLVRRGLSGRLVVAAVAVSMLLVWTYHGLSGTWPEFQPYPETALGWMRYTAPLSLSGTIGALIGMLSVSLTSRSDLTAVEKRLTSASS